MPLPVTMSPGSPLDAVPPSEVERLPAVAIFTRTAARGLVKTRLIPLLGALGAAGLHAAMVADTLRKAQSLPLAIARYIFFKSFDNGPTSLSRFCKSFEGQG